MILKLKETYFVARKLLFSLEIEKILASKKLSSVKKHYKYFIGYLHDSYKVNLFHIMFPRASPHLKEYGGEPKCMYFFI